MKAFTLFTAGIASVIMSCSTLARNNQEFISMAQDIQPVRPDYERANYDKEKIAPFTLEDPLIFLNGAKVRNAEDWQKRRREILDIFAREMYGQEPPAPEELIIEKFEEKEDALAGFAVRSQYNMYFRKDKSGPRIQWLLFRPRHAKKPVPVITLLNYCGNQSMVPDPEIPLMTSWLSNEEGKVAGNRALESTRGSFCDPDNRSIMPIGQIIARGFAFLTASYADISPDPIQNEPDARFSQEPFAYTGVFGLWDRRDETRSDNPTALGAWAWGLSRGADLIERIPELDAKKIVVTGCSRLGKSALLAAARDQRFAVCIPNQCGGGGVTLAKRDYGENIATEVRMFKHWYCKAYRKYEKNPAKLLTFDQHLLLASIAPRPVLVQGFDSPWFDTEGEFLACRAASPVWEMLTGSGLPAVAYPADFDTSAIGRNLGYARRSEQHGFSPWDWQLILDFAARHLLPAPSDKQITSRGIVCFTFDDRNFSDWEKHLPLFQKYRAHVSFFVCGAIDDQALKTMKLLQSQGHTVGLHSQNHADAPPIFRNQGPEAYIREQILPQLEICRKAGLNIRSFAYPNNARTPETDRVMHTIFSHLRAGVGPHPTEDHRFIPADEISTRSYWGGSGIGAYYSSKLPRLMEMLERTAREKCMLVFFSHDIAPSPSRIGIRSDWLEACLKKARELNLEILGFDEI